MPSWTCPICKLEFADPGTARRCEEWCSTHLSCNVEIGRSALNRGTVSPSRDQRFPSPTEKRAAPGKR